MNTPSKDVIERVKVREVSGVFRSPSALDVAVSALLRAGFDRADIDIMADVDEIMAKLRTGSISAGELADLQTVPRWPLIRPKTSSSWSLAWLASSRSSAPPWPR